MSKFVSSNPAKNYTVIGSVDISTVAMIKKKVDEARKAKTFWKELGVERRTEILKPLFEKFFRRQKEIALLITREIGKPISESLSDLDWDKSYFRDFLEKGKEYLKDDITYKDKKSSHRVVYEPLGVAAVIVPWNFPFSNFFWGVIPNLIAGNTVVFKHSEECPLTGRLIEEIMNEIKLPGGVFSEVYGDGEVGEMLVREKIDLIWFTGSSAVGRHLYKIAGEKKIKAILEMGGSNPFIVFEDVDVYKIIEDLYLARFSNNGQVCDSLKRLIVHKKIFEEVVGKLKERVGKAIVRNPEDPKTQLGSLVAKRQLELLESQVEDAFKKGARIVIGGKRPKDLKGAYYLPTILTSIKRNMRVWQEEVFGPVLPIIAFTREEEAVELANDTAYGLGAKVYSKDKKRALRVAAKLEAGCVEINNGNHWLPCNPFGGYKDSGMGREHGKWGFQELCQVKVVSLGK